MMLSAQVHVAACTLWRQSLLEVYMIARRKQTHGMFVAFSNPNPHPKREFQLNKVRTEQGYTEYLVTRVTDTWPLVQAEQFTLEVRRH